MNKKMTLNLALPSISSKKLNPTSNQGHVQSGDGTESLALALVRMLGKVGLGGGTAVLCILIVPNVIPSHKEKVFTRHRSDGTAPDNNVTSLPGERSQIYWG